MRTHQLAPVLTILGVIGVSLSGCSSDSNTLDQPLPQGGGPCASDANCGGATPICDVLAGHCVQCLFDTQCSDGARCRSEACVVPSDCTSSLDCVSVPGATICDPDTSECVACVENVDCTGNADCVSNQCVPYDACETSLDCAGGKVCALLTGRCVECVSDLDCPDGNVCIANECELRTECVSDNQCTASGKLCDKTLGYCVDCLTDDQCPSAYHCSGGACELDACEAGTSKCQGNSLVPCDASGQSWGAPQPCPAETNCTASGSSASCLPWLCDAGLTYCEADSLITCADDGMSVESTVDCAATGQHCSQGKCGAQVCAPNTVFCEGDDVRQCDAAGSASFVVETCGTQEVCDPTTASCVFQLCSPGMPTCNGSVATTCNAAGTGYAAGGTDCVLQDKGCYDGECVGCPVSGVAPTEVRMAELFMGNNDYIVLTNRGSCAAQLDSLALHISSNKPAVLDFDFPAFLLPAGGTVYVMYSASSGDISAPDLGTFLLPSLGEYVALCEGPCAGGDILDYFTHADGGQPPAGPAGVTFTPAALTGINDLNSASHSYMRVAYAGAHPAFTASDWTVAAASRP